MITLHRLDPLNYCLLEDPDIKWTKPPTIDLTDNSNEPYESENINETTNTNEEKKSLSNLDFKLNTSKGHAG